MDAAILATVNRNKAFTEIRRDMEVYDKLYCIATSDTTREMFDAARLIHIIRGERLHVGTIQAVVPHVRGDMLDTAIDGYYRAASTIYHLGAGSDRAAMMHQIDTVLRKLDLIRRIVARKGYP